MESLKEVLMRRDDLTEEAASCQIKEAKKELRELLEMGEDCSDFMEEQFGLEPDYLMELL